MFLVALGARHPRIIKKGVSTVWFIRTWTGSRDSLSQRRRDDKPRRFAADFQRPATRENPCSLPPTRSRLPRSMSGRTRADPCSGSSMPIQETVPSAACFPPWPRLLSLQFPDTPTARLRFCASMGFHASTPAVVRIIFAFSSPTCTPCRFPRLTKVSIPQVACVANKAHLVARFFLRYGRDGTILRIWMLLKTGRECKPSPVPCIKG